MSTSSVTLDQSLTDEEIVARVLGGEIALFELIMRRHNQRLYRAARAIVRDENEAEDVMQDAYVRAYEHLNQFAGKAKFSTWITRIAVHEALARIRHRRRFEDVNPMSDDYQDPMDRLPAKDSSPEEKFGTGELGDILQNAIDALPISLRSVFMLRAVEEMSTAEVAESLELSEDNVKVRLHRARTLLKEQIAQKFEGNAKQTFQFHARRCDRIVANVMVRITLRTHTSGNA